MTRIRVLTTSGKSTPFFDFDSNFLRKLIGRLMTRGGVRKSFPREDATKVLMDDFLPRSEAVLRGIDPQDMHWSKHADDLQSPLTPRLERSWLMKKLPPPNTFLGKMLSRGVQKSIAYFQSALTSGNLIKDVATAVLKAGALMAFHFVTRGPIVMLIKGGAFLGSNVFKGLANIFKEPEVKSPFDSDQNVAHEYGEEDFLGKKGPSYYEKLAAEHAPFLRYVRYDETSARPADGTELRHTLRDDLAAENLLDPFGAPEGSVIEKRAIEGKSFLRVIQPDGIEVYILPQHRTAYARYRPELAHPKAEPMPHALRKLLKDTKNELRVYFDAAANDERGAYSIEDITGYEFEDRLIEEIRQPCKPDKTPLVQSEYLQDLAKRSREFDDGKWAKLARMFVQHASGKVPGFLTRHWYKKYTAPYEAAQTAEKQLWAVNGLPEGKKKVALPEASGPKPEPDQLKMR